MDRPGFEPELNQNIDLKGRSSSPLSYRHLIDITSYFKYINQAKLLTDFERPSRPRGDERGKTLTMVDSLKVNVPSGCKGMPNIAEYC